MKTSDLPVNSVSVTQPAANGKNRVNNKGNRVSKKFYADVDAQIRGAIFRIGCGYDVYLCARIVIDKYISAGIEPDLSELITVRLIFAVLKPQIDKAITRSRMAKERAAARRSAKTGGNPSQATPAADPDRTADDMTAGKTEAEQENEPTVGPLIGHADNTSATTESNEEDLRPLNRRERRDLKRKMLKAKKRALSKGLISACHRLS